MSDSLAPNQIITATVRIFDEHGDSLEVPNRRFQILRKIGSGGMAIVYEAVQLDVHVDHMDHLVAIKVFDANRLGITIIEDDEDEEEDSKKNRAKAKEVLSRFRQEFEIQSAVRQKNIARVIGYGQVGLCPFFILERIQGIGLDKKISRSCKEQGRYFVERVDDADVSRPYFMDELAGRLVDDPVIPWEQFYLAAIGISEALELVHHLQIVHRDIKPSNVMVLDDGSVKILDFGISKVIDAQMRRSFGVQSTLTEIGSVLGTPQYVAPELITNASNVSPRADVYATGIVLFEMATGCRPHMEQQQDLFKRILGEAEVYDIAEYLRNAPEPLRLVILKATQREPSHRYADGGQLRYALEEALEGRIADLEFANTQQQVVDPEIVEEIVANLPTQVYRQSIVEIVAQKAQATARFGRKAIILIAGSSIVIGGLGTAVYLSYAIRQGEDRALIESTQQSVQLLATSVTNSVVDFVRGEDASVQTLPDPLPSATAIVERPVIERMNETQLASYNAGMRISKSNPNQSLKIFHSLQEDGVRDERLLDAIASLEKRLGKTAKKKKPLN